MNIENTAGRISVATLVKILANDYEVRTNPTSYGATEGRVIEDASDGTVWIADGDSWFNVNDDVIIDDLEVNFTPENLIGTSGEAGDVKWHDGTDNVATNAAGLAQYVNGSWESLVDGSVIE